MRVTLRPPWKTSIVVLATALAAALALSACGGAGAKSSSSTETAPPAGLSRAVPPVIRSDCRAAARKLDSGAVYCPPLVPGGGAKSMNRSSRGKRSIDARGGEYVLNFDSPSLAGEDPHQPKGFRRHEGHWLVRAVNTSLRSLTRGPGVAVVGRPSIHGVRVLVAERRWVAYDLDAGHVFALWRLRGHTYEVSLHGFENRRLVLPMAGALIAQMRRCPPPAAGSGGRGACRLVFAAL